MGHHQYQPALDYFDALWRYSGQTAIFVFDDIRWSEGMLRAWAQLRADPRLDITVSSRPILVARSVRRRDPRRSSFTLHTPAWSIERETIRGECDKTPRTVPKHGRGVACVEYQQFVGRMRPRTRARTGQRIEGQFDLPDTRRSMSRSACRR